MEKNKINMESMKICAKRSDHVKSSRRHRGVVLMVAVVVGRNKKFFIAEILKFHVSMSMARVNTPF